MTTHKTRWLLVGLVCLALLPACAPPVEEIMAAAGHDVFAELYRDQGDLASAEGHYRAALAIRVKAFGPEHPDVATNLDNLALIYRLQGKYAEAEEMEARAKAIRAKRAEQNPVK